MQNPDSTIPLDGIHHVTAITADAPANVEFYAGVLGLRLVKKTVNQDDPTVYHLFYADDAGSPGADLTFFEYPGLVRGRAGAGMVHRIGFRVAGVSALDFWAERLRAAGREVTREDGRLLFEDPEGLGYELVAGDGADETPLVASHPEIPSEHAVQGFAGVRAYGRPERSGPFLERVMGFEAAGAGFTSRGPERSSWYRLDGPPEKRGLAGAGTVHHVAWASTMDDHVAWRERVAASGAMPTPVIDRFYFRSIYFREPGGVLFEIATKGPGFASDEDPAHLGERLSLPPAFEGYRERVEATLRPLPDPRARALRR